MRISQAGHRRFEPPWRIGIDVGGTFTDVVVIDARGTIVVKKSPTMPRDPGAGIFRALEAVARQMELSLGGLLAACAALIHGSTIATNIVLEGKVARVGLLRLALRNMICVIAHPRRASAMR
jgi:N-methylhydantoinase A